MLPASQIQHHQHSHRHRQPQLLKWLHEQQRPGRLRGIMEKERNKQFIRQAQERGYLQSPSETAIIKACQEREPGTSTLDEVLMVRLCGIHLRDVGAVGQCSNLMVCNLAGNYIKSFEALAPCRRLVKLDLHGNQINQLPGENFWAGMSQLKMVHLHDNSISRLDYLQAVGAASNLYILTLYDTPISLKMTYRHHVVNSVWSLKALDHHVISDEEIIEDAYFGGHFSMLHSAFYIDTNVPCRKDATLGEELSQVGEVLRRVSYIQAKNSPVLIIQRYIRGWLARRRFKIMARTKVWAMVTIQRFWRAYKGYEWKPTQEGSGQVAPPSTSILETTTARKMSVTPPQVSSTAPSHPKLASPGPAVMSSSATEASGSRMDYDTYLRNRRPGSTCRSPSLASAAMTMGDKGQRQRSADAYHVRLAEEKESLMTPTTAATLAQRRDNFVVRMRQLQSDLHLTSEEEAQLEALLREGVRPGLGRSMGQDIRKPSRPKETKKKKKKRKSVGEMLGTLSDSELLRDRSSDDYSEEDDEYEVSTVKFRLSGLTPAVNRLDPTQELLISRREAGKDVRMGLAAHFTQKAATAEPPRKHAVPKKPMNADQKLFARTQGTMGMSCLKAVLQAYRDREHSDKYAAKRDKVAAMREQREEGKMRAKSFLEEKRMKAMQQRDKEVGEISQEYDKQAEKEIEEQERRREIRGRDADIAARVRRENTFSHDFNSQHTSISNALLRHDWQARSDKLILTRKDFVEGEHKHEMGQRELVRRYLEHRKLMRQAKVAVEKASVEARVVQESNDRLMEARLNVSRQKEKANRIQAFYPLPKCATNPVLPPVKREGKPDRWNTLISMFEGRVGNHPAMSGAL